MIEEMLGNEISRTGMNVRGISGLPRRVSSVSKSNLPSTHLQRRPSGRPACNECKQKVQVHVCQVTFFAVMLELVVSDFEVVQSVPVSDRTLF